MFDANECDTAILISPFAVAISKQIQITLIFRATIGNGQLFARDAQRRQEQAKQHREELEQRRGAEQWRRTAGQDRKQEKQANASCLIALYLEVFVPAKWWNK